MKHLHNPCVVIVDGYSTGRELVRELAQRGATCLHLRSTERIPRLASKSFDARAYDADLGYLGSVDAAVGTLPSVAPDAVVAGSEWGVTYAEFVAEGLGLPTNRIETVGARRNKFNMIEAVRAQGLRAAEQASVESAQEAHLWAERRGRWPVVVKPMLSAGSDGVVICRNHDDIDYAFSQALYRENLLGCFNERLLVQSYLAGRQFIVNTVSRNGRHCVTDAWHYAYRTVPGGSVAAGSMELLDPALPANRALIDYTLEVLPALGIENGAAHSEIRWTPDGPALIETGARLMGGAMDAASYRAAGLPTQASRYADVLTMREGDEDAVMGDGCYTLARHLTKVFFIFEEAADVTGTEGLAKLRTLPSFHAHYRALEPGARVWRTSDSLFCGGAVYLVHDDVKQIEADAEQFREWEEAGELYGLRPVSAHRSRLS
jgi:hypothetical protein